MWKIAEPLSIHVKLKKVQTILFESSPVLVAFSGGVDSTLLLKLALDTLGPEQVLAVTGLSPSVPPSELENAARLAETLKSPWMTIGTEEMNKTEYRANPTNRCFYCKEELFTKLHELAKQKGFKTVVDGSNADDAKDWRPGREAARQWRVRSPLLEADLSKEEVRSLSKEFDLPTWNKPAMPCLSSRIPYGEPVTEEKLARIDAAEKMLRQAGFQEVRVRDHFPTAKIEVLPAEIPRLTEETLRARIVSTFKSLGYRFITVDLAGFKSGNLNRYDRQGTAK